MASCKDVVLCALALFVSCNALSVFVPNGKEYVYDYAAIVKTGTLVPYSFASQFLLNGKLHMQMQGSSLSIKLADLKYQMYNGILNHQDELLAKDVPLPAEVEALTKPFKIVYDDSGKVLNLVVDKSDTIWSINIKKSFASVLQLEWNKILEQPVTHGFMTKEHSIYGVNDVQYTVIYPEPSVIEVQKLVMLPSTKNLLTHSITPTVKGSCESPEEDIISRDSQRKYLINNQGGVNKIIFVEANGGIYYHPLNGQSETQYLLTNQTLNFVEEVPAKEPWKIVEQVIDDISYQAYEELDNTETIPSLYTDRRIINSNVLVPVVLEKIEQIWAYLQKNHLHLNTPDIKENQVINDVNRVMKYLDVNALNEVYKKILTKPDYIQKIFYEMLPLIGSKASSVMILKLVQDNTIRIDTLLELLYKFPKHVIAPSQDVIVAMEGLIHLDSKIPWETRKAAILAFANLIKFSYNWSLQVNEYKHTVNEYILDNNLDNDVPTNINLNKTIITFYEKYVLLYVNNLKSTQNLDEQITYIYGLANMKLDIILPYLVPMVKGELWSDHHHRLIALWAIAPLLADNPVEAYNILWPILVNTNEHTELRIAAYWILMEDISDLPLFMNIYWVLKNEPNGELYSFHYSYIKSLVTRMDPCYSEMQKYASKFIQYMNPPKYGASSYDIFDYTDIKYKWGTGVHGILINTNESVIISALVSSQMLNIYHDDLNIYVKVHGISNWNPFDMTSNPEESKYTLKENVAKIFYSSGEVINDLHIEIVISYHDQVIHSLYMGSKDLENIWKMPFIKTLLTVNLGEAEQDIYIHYEKYSTTIIPTDIGMPALFDISIPWLSVAKEKYSKDAADTTLTIHIDNQYTHWIPGKHGLSVYNSIVDVWQGINRYHSYNIYLPLLMDIVLNIEKQNIKFSVKKNGDSFKDLFGLRSHVTSAVFVKEDLKKNILKSSSQNSEDFVLVSAGDKYRHDYPILYKDDLLSGRQWDVMVYDSEFAVSNGSWGVTKHMILEPWKKNFDDPLEYLSLVALNSDTYLYLLPKVGTHGVLVRVVPKAEVTSLDLTLRWDLENFDQLYEYSIGAKYNSRITYAVKSDEKSLKTWDINTVLDLNPGNTNNKLKIYITRIVPGQKDYKICIEGSKKWSPSGVTGNLNIALGQTNDGKCVLDDGNIDISMIGELSEEQLDNAHVPEDCLKPMPYYVKPYHTWECLYAYSSIRKYTYNVQAKVVPTAFKNYYFNWVNYIQSYNLPYFTYNEESDVSVGEHNAKVQVIYGLNPSDVNIDVWTSKHWYSLSGLPLSKWSWFGFYPDSLIYSNVFLLSYLSGDLDYLKIDHEKVTWHSEQLVQKQLAVSNDWVVYLSDLETDANIGISVKKVSNEFLGLKLKVKTHTIEVIPGVENWTYIVDGKPITDNSHNVGSLEWVYWNHIGVKGLIPESLVLMLPESGLFIEFDGSVIYVLTPFESKWYGITVL